MIIAENFKSMPWDVSVFGRPCYEIFPVTSRALERARKNPGHYTVRIDPLASKKELHENGFYYCDSLIEPYCTPDRFAFYESSAVILSQDISLDPLFEICHGAFFYGRFHRDFNLAREAANARYDNWLKHFYDKGDVIAVLYEGELAGFFCISENKLMLHAVLKKLQGKGLSKYFWSAVCRKLFQLGHKELTSSVSATNLPVVNLYASLGFRFRNTLDVYHLFVA